MLNFSDYSRDWEGAGGRRVREYRILNELGKAMFYYFVF